MNGIGRFWGKHFLGLELIVSIVLAAAFVAWCSRWGGAAQIDNALLLNRAAVYGALASVFGALLGFAITTFALLLGFSGSPQMAEVREHSSYPLLWRVYKSTVRALSIATVFALAGLIADKDNPPNRIVMYAVAWAVLYSALRLARAVWVLELVTDILTTTKRRTAIQPPNVVP